MFWQGVGSFRACRRVFGRHTIWSITQAVMAPIMTFPLFCGNGRRKSNFCFTVRFAAMSSLLPSPRCATLFFARYAIITRQ
jgi:hypothetical protein